MYNADFPISSYVNDLLGRSSYAKELAHTILNYGIQEALCIGLLGSWGSGKTSVLNMMIEEIENGKTDKKITIIKFEPWNFTSTEQLLTQFFVMLSQKFLSTKDKFMTKAGNAIATYASFFDFLSLVPAVGAPLSTVAKSSVSRVGKWLNKGITGKSIQEQKKVVEDLLRQIKGKLLIVIDDIDRLSNDQIRQVFQLVTSVARFPNTVYLLSFDRDVVVKALEKVQEGNGNTYLEKVIQVPLNLPDVSSGKIEEVLVARLGNIIVHYDMTYDRLKWSAFYYSCVKPHIKTLREINRLCNLLLFKLSAIANEVDFLDMVAITILEIVYPEIYEWVKQHKILLTGVNDGSIPSLLKKSEEVMRTECQTELQEILLSCGLDHSELAVRRIYSSLSAIFPYMCLHSVPRNSVESLRKDNRVAHPDKFDRYFNLSIDAIALRRNDIEIAVNNMSDTELSVYLTQLDKKGTLDELLAEIDAQGSKMTDQRAKTMVHALWQTLATFTSCTTHFLSLPTSDRAEYLVRNIMVSHSNVNWASYTSELMQNADWNMMIGISRFLHVMSLAYGQFGVERERLEYEKVIGKEELICLEEQFARKIRDNITTYDILSYPKARIAFFMLKSLDKDFIEEFLSEALQHPINVIKYMAASIIRWTGTTISYELQNEYLTHVNDDQVAAAILQCVDDQSLFLLSDYEQEAAAAYILLKTDNNKDSLEERATLEAVRGLLITWKSS